MDRSNDWTVPSTRWLLIFYYSRVNLITVTNDWASSPKSASIAKRTAAHRRSKQSLLRPSQRAEKEWFCDKNIIRIAPVLSQVIESLVIQGPAIAVSQIMSFIFNKLHLYSRLHSRKALFFKNPYCTKLIFFK